MHFPPVPFWLMIASIATAVLPVWRSPMMSSRCPRPIGMSASTAFTPVASGTPTPLRVITPGATLSMGRKVPPRIAPLPSLGFPSGSMTRPSTPSDTGMERMRPVAFTVSPSLMPAVSPITMAPTVSSSRLRATPKMPPGNSIISEAWSLESPERRATPSETERTVPTCSSFNPAWNAESCSLRASRMSDFVAIALDAFHQGLLETIGSAEDGVVDHAVIHSHARAADERWIRDERHVSAFRKLGHGLLHLRRERMRRFHGHARHAVALAPGRVHAAYHLADAGEVPVVLHPSQERADRLVERLPFLPLGGGDERGGELFGPELHSYSLAQAPTSSEASFSDVFSSTPSFRIFLAASTANSATSRVSSDFIASCSSLSCPLPDATTRSTSDFALATSSSRATSASARARSMSAAASAFAVAST